MRDGFYGSADLQQPLAPGDVIAAEPFVAYAAPGVRLPGQAWRLRYVSTTATGTLTTVSGAVLIPRAPAGKALPLIGFAPGSQGLTSRAAPSRMLSRGTLYEGTVLALLLRHGWAVAVTDYPGLGVPGEGHPYVVGRALGPAVLDAVRAARELPAIAAHGDGPIALLGYSEGGAAAGWAAQLQPAYAPDVALRAVCLGGVPADLARVRAHVDNGRFWWLQLYTAIGMDIAYPELDLAPFLTDRGLRVVQQLSEALLLPVIGKSLVGRRHRLADVVTADPFADPAWRRRTDENRLGGAAPAAPVLLQHARFDQAVEYEQSKTLAADWRALGADVTYCTLHLHEHLAGGFTAHCRAMLWLARRMNTEDQSERSQQ